VREGRQWDGFAVLLLSGFAGFAEFFHYRLDEFLGVSEFLGDNAQVHGGDGGVALTGAIDAVLADEDEGVGDAVERDGEAAAVAPEALLEVLEFVVMLFKSGHGGSFPRRPQLAQIPRIDGRCTSGTGPRRESLPYRSPGR
jgi:hypothetical protein